MDLPPLFRTLQLARQELRSTVCERPVRRTVFDDRHHQVSGGDAASALQPHRQSFVEVDLLFVRTHAADDVNYDYGVGTLDP